MPAESRDWSQSVDGSWMISVPVPIHSVAQLHREVALLQIWIRRDMLDRDILSLQLCCRKCRPNHKLVSQVNCAKTKSINKISTNLVWIFLSTYFPAWTFSSLIKTIPWTPSIVMNVSFFASTFFLYNPVIWPYPRFPGPMYSLSSPLWLRLTVEKRAA